MIMGVTSCLQDYYAAFSPAACMLVVQDIFGRAGCLWDLESKAIEPQHANTAVPPPLLLQACWTSSM